MRLRDKGNVLSLHAARMQKRKDESAGNSESFDRHEQIIRLKLFDGLFDESFMGLVETVAREIGIDGWIRLRTQDGSADVLLAGTASDVEAMMRVLKGSDGAHPMPMMRVENVELRGDEPIWTEFHLLPAL